MYIKRTLWISNNSKDKRLVTEDEIPSLGRAVIVVGEPGAGKTALAIELGKKASITMVSAGKFCRTSAPRALIPETCSTLVIDGLDEVSTHDLNTSLDKLLHGLSALNYPNVILTCRAADWQSGPGTAKFAQDYDGQPIIVHIERLNKDQEFQFLADRCGVEVAKIISAEISRVKLEEVAGNPLTLGMMAQVVQQGNGLPTERQSLMDRVVDLLAQERNQIHAKSQSAPPARDALIEAAGCAAAHMLLSGASGIWVGNPADVPAGFLLPSLATDGGGSATFMAAMRTRLFLVDGEDQMIFVHRSFAEFLGAKWLSNRVASKQVSKRRLIAHLHTASGVPSSLRGLNAWLGCFSPSLRRLCISADPYGFLRYGDISILSSLDTGFLLTELEALAEDDPYFRAEDWSVGSIPGLARLELKEQLLRLITKADRKAHLSTLILRSLSPSPLGNELLPEILSILRNDDAPYVERSDAARALIRSASTVDWPDTVLALSKSAAFPSIRLALQIVGELGPEVFPSELVAELLLAVHGVDEDKSDFVLGVDYLILKSASPNLAGLILDQICGKLAVAPQMSKLLPFGLATAFAELIAKVFSKEFPEPSRFLSWCAHLRRAQSCDQKHIAHVTAILTANSEYRHTLQSLVLLNPDSEIPPWHKIVDDLFDNPFGLALTDTDCGYFLEQVASIVTLSAYHTELWRDILHYARHMIQKSAALQRAVVSSIERHPELREIHDKLMNAPVRDFAAEHAEAARNHSLQEENEKARRRQELAPHIDSVRQGENLSIIVEAASIYLGFGLTGGNAAEPDARLVEVFGAEFAQAATEGFVAILDKHEFPTLLELAVLLDEKPQRVLNFVPLAGVSSAIRATVDLSQLPDAVNLALAAYWSCGGFFDNMLGENVRYHLETEVLNSPAHAEDFLQSLIGNQIAAGRDVTRWLNELMHSPAHASIAQEYLQRWLFEYPQAHTNVQKQLLETAVGSINISRLRSLVEERISGAGSSDPESRILWKAAELIFAPMSLATIYKRCASVPPGTIWSVASLFRHSVKNGVIVSREALERIIATFAPSWQSVEMPKGCWSGDENPWDASRFLRDCISRLGNDPALQASEILARLSDALADSSYADQLKHVAASQKKLCLDHYFEAPSIEVTRSVLVGGMPASASDLKLLLVDEIEELARYLRNGDTRSYEQFWNVNEPHVENTCRDRLLDLLRPRLAPVFELYPELPVADSGRVDIFVRTDKGSLPIEVKGQWHRDLWNAASTQLDSRYLRDWRTDGHGIYLIFWFGDVAKKSVTLGPIGKEKPRTPGELKEQIEQSLTEIVRQRISVVVVDVSRP